MEEAKRAEEHGEPADGESLGSRDSATEPEVGLEEEDEEILVLSQVQRLGQLKREQQRSTPAGAGGRGSQHDPARGEGGSKVSGGTT